MRKRAPRARWGVVAEHLPHVTRHFSLEALDPEQQNGVVQDGVNRRLRGRGRGAGVAPSVTSHSAVSNAQLPNPSTLNSPFAQIDQRNSPANPFGNHTIQQSQSPFSAIANGNTGRNGQPAPRGAIKRSFPRQSPTSSTNSGSMASVPVEDASTVASYHERYEQVSIINH
jgi:hypothetical protein